MPWVFATSSIFHASFGRAWDCRLWPTDGADDFLCTARSIASTIFGRGVRTGDERWIAESWAKEAKTIMLRTNLF
jgi:hypothetical protein